MPLVVPTNALAARAWPSTKPLVDKNALVRLGRDPPSDTHSRCRLGRLGWRGLPLPSALRAPLSGASIFSWLLYRTCAVQLARLYVCSVTDRECGGGSLTPSSLIPLALSPLSLSAAALVSRDALESTKPKCAFARDCSL